MLGVKVMLFGLDSRVRDVIDFHVYSKIFTPFPYLLCDVEYRELLGELVTDLTFFFGRRIKTGEFNAPNGIPDIQKSACLAALSVDRQRLADGRLHAETIQNRAKDFVVIQTIDQSFVHGYFVRHRAVDDALIKVRGPQSPNLAGKHH